VFKPGSLLLGLTLSGTLAATAQIGLQESTAEPVPVADAVPEQVLPSASTQLPVPGDRVQFDALEQNPFDAKTWYVPPPPPPSVAAIQPEEPPKPTAPPLPFSYVGRMEEGSGRVVVYLAQGGRALTVGAGDNIDGQYRLEGIEDAAIRFTYLPLGIKQTLPIARNDF
jgi:hypothetical protein